jgi:hypothetical protein
MTAPHNLGRLKPIYGQSYGLGWIGFVRSFGFVSDAIEYGERWEREQSYPVVTHALIVIGDNACVEAHAEVGVRLANLSDYLTDPKCKVYFREPLDLTPALASCIAICAKGQVGSSYDDLLIAEQAIADTLAGHWLNRLLGGLPHRLTAAALDRPRSFICSYLAAYTLASQPQWAGRGILAGPLAAIDPQTLFESDLFEPFINDCSFQSV